MDADGGKLSLVRIGTGLRGATGQTGATGADGADGIGTGDITAVNTPNNRGLSGGDTHRAMSTWRSTSTTCLPLPV